MANGTTRPDTSPRCAPRPRADSEHMQRIIVNVVDGTRARRRGHEEVDDVVSNGMAQAVAHQDIASVAALLLSGVHAAALDGCGQA
jgi:hypothetical protein